MKLLLTISIIFISLSSQAQKILLDDEFIYCYLDTTSNLIQCQSYYRGNYYVNVRQGYKYAYGMDLRICCYARFAFKNVPSVIEIHKGKEVTKKTKYRYIKIGK